MPLFPTLKTYSRKNRYISKYTTNVKQVDFPVSEASSVFDALLVKNIERRESLTNTKNKYNTRAITKSKDLSQSSSTSLHVKINSTFDNLLNGTNYNVVNFRNISSVYVNSSTEKSSEIKKYNSPYNTRYNNKKKSVISKRKNTSKTKRKVTRARKQNNSKSNKKKKNGKSSKAVGVYSEKPPKSKLKSNNSNLGTVSSISNSKNALASSKKEVSSGVNANKIKDSYEKSISHSLVIEKVIEKRHSNSVELSRILKEETKKYYEKLNNNPALNTSNLTAIASTSRVIKKSVINNNNDYASIFQHGFQHRMRAESTPKYITSSTPIVSGKYRKVNEKIDISPIERRNRTKLNFNSLLELKSIDSNISKLNKVKSNQELLSNEIITINSTDTDTSNIKLLSKEHSDVIDTRNIKLLSTSMRRRSSLLPIFSDTYNFRNRLVLQWKNLKDMSYSKKATFAADKKLTAVPLVIINNYLPDLDVITSTSRNILRMQHTKVHQFSSSKISESQKINESKVTVQNTLYLNAKRKSDSSVRYTTLNCKSKSLFNEDNCRNSTEDNVQRRINVKESELVCENISVDIIESTQMEIFHKQRKHITTRKKYTKIRTKKRRKTKNYKSNKNTSKSFSISLYDWERFSQSKLNLMLGNKLDSHTVSNEIDENNLNCLNTSSKGIEICDDSNFDNVAKSNTEVQLILDNESNVNKSLKDISTIDLVRYNETDLITLEDNCERRSKRMRYSKCPPKEVTDFSSSNIDKKGSIFLKPGKQWFRSLSILRNSSVNKEKLSELCNHKGRRWRETVCALYDQQDKNQSTVLNCSNGHKNYKFGIESNRSRLQSVRHQTSVRIVAESPREYSTLEKTGYISTVANESILGSFDKLSLTADVGDREQTARQIILKRCGQIAPESFEECYSPRTLQKCRKIGEGVYGEVYMYKTSDSKCKVMKIIPIEGSQEVNGERQKKFEEIFSEIVIASELSNLRTNKEFCTDAFGELLKIYCVQGKYPKELIDLWDLYDEDHGSENDSPDIFTDDQLYIILELSNGGQDLEAYQFNNAEQTYALFVQIICALAVAESAFKFEHRDMHWGNILISRTDEPTSTVRLNGRELEISNKGVKLAIIDFTLSRMTYNNCSIYNDLALDPDLFTAIGDYQFDIYRLMQKRNENDWQKYEPYSNILWLDYTLEKMIKQVRYLRANTRTHKSFLRRLTQLRKNILSYNSATELINSEVFSHMFL